jgi:hypothetical protein
MKSETLKQVKELADVKKCSQAEVIRELVSFGLEHTGAVYGKRKTDENAPVIDLESKIESEPENSKEETVGEEPKPSEVEKEEFPKSEPEKDDPGNLFLMAKQRMKKQAGKEIGKSIETEG